MMSAPKVAVLFGFGINCDHETAAVFNLVGGDSERVARREAPTRIRGRKGEGRSD